MLVERGGYGVAHGKRVVDNHECPLRHTWQWTYIIRYMAKGWETAGGDGAASARMSVVGHFILSCQKATAAAALTLSESTP